MERERQTDRHEVPLLHYASQRQRVRDGEMGRERVRDGEIGRERVRDGEMGRETVKLVEFRLVSWWEDTEQVGEIWWEAVARGQHITKK
jgi:hypothetical protein